VIAVLLPVVIIAGLVLGAILSQEDDPNGEKAVGLAEGTLEGTHWRVAAERDVEGEACAFLYADDEQLTGACSLTPQDATFGNQTVVFGRAASTADSVSVELSNGDVVEITTEVAEGIDGRFYVQVVDGDVDVSRVL
jgi:hypothetical protein